MSVDELIRTIRNRHPITDDEAGKVLSAYAFSRRAHTGQKRRSGEPFFTHPYIVALTVAQWGMDTPTIVAALLHDIAEDTDIKIEEIQKHFGETIAFLVNGVTKVGRVKYRGNEAQSETLKKMILALGEDLRVVFIKLADRLHNMRTLAALPAQKQKRIALETNEIYAPLAYRLGMGNLSGELEDLAFPYLHPKEHQWLKKHLATHFAESEKYLERVEGILLPALKSAKIKIVRVDKRAKRLSSLFKKLKRMNMDVSQVHDLVAFRIIVPDIESCYAALGVIHKLWPPLPGRIKDYIALPKPNGYRSLHTTVICLDNRPTEFQIRTEKMHQENEQGAAAYWAYQSAKNSTDYQEGKTIFADKRLDWINKLRDWQSQFKKSTDFVNSMKIDFFQDRIFAITPHGEVVDLPAGATPLDFAFAIHSDIGNHTVGAKVNDKLVGLDQELQSGDMVEILTQKNRLPSQSWLGIVKTDRAKSRIRSVLRQYSSSSTMGHKTEWRIIVRDRIGLLKDLLAIFSRQKINIVSTNTHDIKGSTFRLVRIVAVVPDKSVADQLLIRFRKLKEISESHYSFVNRK